jgi:cyanophycinase
MTGWRTEVAGDQDTGRAGQETGSVGWPGGRVHLVGGGWSQQHTASVYGPFVDELRQRAVRRSRTTARVGIIQLFDSTSEDGKEKLDQFATILTALGPCRPVPILVPEGDTVTADALDGLDGLLVAGGLTPAYLAAVTPVAAEIRALVAGGSPYLGFSAGAAVAATTAIIGGWRSGDLVITAEDCSEGLDQVTTVPGVGLVDVAVDVHAAQSGTLTRAVTVVRRGDVVEAVAIDDDTACIVIGSARRAVGAGQTWWVRRAGAGVTVRTVGSTDPAPPT